MTALALYVERVTGEITHPTGVLLAAAAVGAPVPVEMATLVGGRTAGVPADSGARQAALVALACRRVREIGVVRLSRLLSPGTHWAPPRPSSTLPGRCVCVPQHRRGQRSVIREIRRAGQDGR